MSVITSIVTMQSERMATLGNPGYGRQGWRLRNSWDEDKGTKYVPYLWLGG